MFKNEGEEHKWWELGEVADSHLVAGGNPEGEICDLFMKNVLGCMPETF